ncbi:MAG: nucleotidyltransferase family protein [Rhodospirillales bacterium]
MSLAGLILAAGASSRMGRPKPLLAYRGETFLDCLIGLLGSRCSPVVVVLGHDAETIRAGCRRADEAAFVVNANWREGQLSSMQCGLRAVPAGAGGVLFTPVDYPAISGETVDALAARFEQGGAPLVIPRYNGRRGHPVCCSSELIEEFLSLPSGSQARDVVRRHAGQAIYVDVNDPGVLLDVDDPEAYDNLSRVAGSR